jgi:hypothetical protein
MSRIAGIVIDCRDAYTVAPFWSLVTGLPIVPDDLGKIVGRSLAPGEAVLLRDPDGARPEVWIAPAGQLAGPGRIHLDVVGGESELTAFVAAGATVVRETGKWTVLADPEGNEFCLVPAGH